ncbi:hypothetical protein, partial [Streptomyces lydicus]|uniref:hypothetical protein n=1 Tax=Streptomyces lydicus TaxID=47763 RepID=UPI0037910F29
MSGHPSFPTPRSAPAKAMTAPEIDEALSALARCSTVLLKESDAEQQRMEELNELSETSIQQRAEGQGSPYDAECALLSVRLRLAIRCAKAHRDAAHEFGSLASSHEGVTVHLNCTTRGDQRVEGANGPGTQKSPAPYGAGLSHNDCSAASYSPTGSPLQY